MFRLALALTFLALVWLAPGCKPDASVSKAVAAQDTLAPEDVLIRWQGYIDQDQYDSARALSGPNVVPFIQFLQNITLPTDATEPVSLTLLRNLACTVAGDSAVCTYVTKDEIGQDVPDTVVLRRVQGRWLVDRIYNNGEAPGSELLEGGDMPFPGDDELE